MIFFAPTTWFGPGQVGGNGMDLVDGGAGGFGGGQWMQHGEPNIEMVVIGGKVELKRTNICWSMMETSMHHSASTMLEMVQWW